MADNTERLAAHDHLGAGQVACHAFGVEAFSLLSIPLDEGGGIIDFATGFREWFALFECHQQCEIFTRIQDQPVPFPKNGRALLRQQVPPGWKGIGGRGNGVRRLLGIEGCDPGERRAGGRICNLEAAAVAAGDPASADIGELAQQVRVGEAGKRVVERRPGKYGSHGGLLWLGGKESARGRAADCLLPGRGAETLAKSRTGRRQSL
jgi:hypothetical protein